MLNFFRNLSTVEWIIIALILLFVFGRKTFVSLGRTGGETLREVKKIKKNFSEAVKDDDEPAKT